MENLKNLTCRMKIFIPHLLLSINVIKLRIEKMIISVFFQL